MAYYNNTKNYYKNNQDWYGYRNPIGFNAVEYHSIMEVEKPPRKKFVGLWTAVNDLFYLIAGAGFVTTSIFAIKGNIGTTLVVLGITISSIVGLMFSCFKYEDNLTYNKGLVDKIKDLKVNQDYELALKELNEEFPGVAMID